MAAGACVLCWGVGSRILQQCMHVFRRKSRCVCSYTVHGKLPAQAVRINAVTGRLYLLFLRCHAMQLGMRVRGACFVSVGNTVARN